MYCLIKDDMFLLPSRDDVVEHRVVVTTLSTSQVLLDLDVLHGFFTHILIDEAAQALEPEALTALKFAGTNTKVVFTGDHMQVLGNTVIHADKDLGLGAEVKCSMSTTNLVVSYLHVLLAVLAVVAYIHHGLKTRLIDSQEKVKR